MEVSDCVGNSASVGGGVGLKKRNDTPGVTLIGEFRNVQKQTEYVRPKLHLHETILRSKQIMRLQGGTHCMRVVAHTFLLLQTSRTAASRRAQNCCQLQTIGS